MGLNLPVWKLPTGNGLDVSATAGALYVVGRGNPLAIALATVTKHIIVIGLFEAKLPLAEFFGLKVSGLFRHFLIPSVPLPDSRFLTVGDHLRGVS